MKTTVKHVGLVRGKEWEGPEDASIAHREVIEHWCDGGEVEIFFDNSWVDMEPKHPRFNENYNYRIKQRDLVRGEVWTNDITERPFLVGDSELKPLSGCDGTPSIMGNGFTYSSPSVEAYYAREFLKSLNGAHEDQPSLLSLLMCVKKSARVDVV